MFLLLGDDIIKPDISIIIPVHNGANTIRKTIDSCLSQTYKNFEILVIDNASTDDTKEIVQSFKSNKIRYIYTHKKGRSNARNMGLRESSGEWIQFLDADDTLGLEKLKKAVELLKKNTTCQAVQCSTEYIKNGKIIKIVKPYVEKDMYENLLLGNFIPINSILLNKSICKLFPLDMEYCEDWVFWIESLENCNMCFDTDYNGAKVFVHDSNTMSNVTKMKIYELEVLLRYREKSVVFKKRIIREIKILKRYIEYLLSTERRNIYIESSTEKVLVYKIITRLCKNNYIRKYLKKKIREKNEGNVYL